MATGELNSPVIGGSEVPGVPLKSAFSEAPIGGWDVEEGVLGVELHSSGIKGPAPQRGLETVQLGVQWVWVSTQAN